jgi:hypothetical protein
VLNRESVIDCRWVRCSAIRDGDGDGDEDEEKGLSFGSNRMLTQHSVVYRDVQLPQRSTI